MGAGSALRSPKRSPPPSRQAWLWPWRGPEALSLRWACKGFSFKISPCLALPVGAPSWQGPSVLGSCSFWYFTVTGHHETDGSCAQMMAGSVWASVRGIGLQATAGPHHPDAVFGVRVGRGSGQQPQGRAFGNICPLLCPPDVWSQALRSKAPAACLTAVYTLTDLGTEAGPAGGGTVSACQMHTPLSV